MQDTQKKLELYTTDMEIKKYETNRKKKMAKYIGNNILEYRKKMNLTREQLDEKSHITMAFEHAFKTISEIIPGTLWLIKHFFNGHFHGVAIWLWPFNGLTFG